MLFVALKCGLMDLGDFRSWRVLAREMDGRIEDARAALAAFRQAVDRTRFVFYRYIGLNLEVMLALIDGRFADAERHHCRRLSSRYARAGRTL